MPVAYDPKACVFLLNTNDMTYAMAVGEGGLLCHCYWGERVQQPEDVAQDQMLYPDQEWYQEYAGWGGNFYNQHALKATFADGTRNVLLRYQSHEIQGESLTVAMEDPDLHLQVELRYALYPELNIINRSAKIQNAGKAGVKLENAFSATWRLPLQMHYRLTHLSGAWGREYTVQRQEVQNGSFVMETRTGLSGPEHAPVFLLDDDGRANELSGMVYFGTLQWSGNFKMIVEKDEYDHLSVTGGINDFDFEWPLPPGESFETPIFTAGLSTEGFSGASRLLHRYQRRYLMRKVDADRLLPVVFNAYGTFFADINEEKMMRLVEMADRIGIEAFLIDAGWSGVGEEYQRGMGDWNINEERFPHRMKNISEALHQRGIKFGLWLEPEIAHTQSRLVKEHPDWVLRYPGREPYVIKVNRLVLNFALDEVWQDILQKTIRIIETCGVDYYKMDLNRLAIEYGSPLFPQ